MNKVVLITGAAHRIGKETAKVFFDAGWNIIIHFNRSEAAAKELADQFNNLREGSACIVQADLDVDQDVERLIKEARDAYNRIDALINNASSFFPTPLQEISYEDWNKLMGSNLKGPLFITRGLADLLKSSNGSVINITDGQLNFTATRQTSGITLKNIETVLKETLNDKDTTDLIIDKLKK